MSLFRLTALKNCHQSKSGVIKLSEYYKSKIVASVGWDNSDRFVCSYADSIVDTYWNDFEERLINRLNALSDFGKSEGLRLAEIYKVKPKILDLSYINTKPFGIKPVVRIAYVKNHIRRKMQMGVRMDLESGGNKNTRFWFDNCIRYAEFLADNESWLAQFTMMIKQFYNTDKVPPMVYDAILDDKTCDACEERNGKPCKLGDEDDVSLHPNCRCGLEPSEEYALNIL